MAERSPSARAVIFISYAREDQALARRLDEALRLKGLETRADWMLMRGEDFRQQLDDFIAESDALIAVISPSSTASEACAGEIERAVVAKKRILPALHRDIGDLQLRKELRDPQWAYFRETDDFITEVEKLVAAITTDFALMPEHRRLQIAAEEWDRNGRRRDYLLSPERLKVGLDWLAATARHPDRLPQPTALQTELIVASQRGRTRGLRIAFGLAMALLLLFAGIAMVAWRNAGRAATNEQIARLGQARANAQTTRAEAERERADQQTSEANLQRDRANQQTREANLQRDRANQQTLRAEAQRLEAERNLASAYVRQARLRLSSADRSSAALLAARAVELDDNFFHRAELGLALQELPVLVASRRDANQPAAWSPDGATLVSGSPIPLTLRARFFYDRGGSDPVDVALRGSLRSVAWNTPGTVVATGDRAGWVSLWSPRGTLTKELHLGASVDAVAFSNTHDVPYLAAVSGGRAFVLDSSLQTIASFLCNTGEMPLLAWAPHKPMLAVATNEGLVQLWEGGHEAHVISGKLLPREHMRFTMPGVLRWSWHRPYLYAGGGSEPLRVWDGDGIVAPALNMPASLIPKPDGWPRSIAWSPDGTRMIADGHVWGADGEYLGTFPGGAGEMAWAKNGLVAHFGDDEILTIWREEVVAQERSVDPPSREWRPVATLKTTTRWHGPRPTVAWAHGESRLMLANQRALWVWDTSTIDPNPVPRRPLEVVLEEYLSPDRKTIVDAGSPGVQVVDVATRRRTWPSPRLTAFVQTASWTRDSRRFATGGADGVVRVWSVDGTHRKLGEHDGVVSVVRWSPDERQLASAGWDGTVRLWDVWTGRTRVLTGHREPVAALEWSPDGELFVSGSDYNVGTSRNGEPARFGSFAAKREPVIGRDPVRLWRRDGTLVRTIPHDRLGVDRISWSPDSRFFATPYDNDSVWIWSRSGDRVATLDGIEIGSFDVIAWSADSTKIVVGGGSNVAKIFRRDGTTVSRIAHSAKSHWLEHAAFSPDGTMLVTAANDYVIRGWWVSSGEEAAILDSRARVRELWWSADGLTVGAFGHWRDSVRKWGASTMSRSSLALQISRIVGLELSGFETRPLAGD